jgi:hypothetical protein
LASFYRRERCLQHRFVALLGASLHGTTWKRLVSQYSPYYWSYCVIQYWPYNWWYCVIQYRPYNWWYCAVQYQPYYWCYRRARIRGNLLGHALYAWSLLGMYSRIHFFF